MANKGLNNCIVTSDKTDVANIIVYATSSSLYTSGINQTCTPSDLVKLQGSSEQERLACWFDDGSGEISHTFQTYNDTSNGDAIVECVQLVPKPYKYLVRNNDTIYTVSDGALTAVTGVLNAQLFQNYGVEIMPDGTLLMTLSNPEVLCWKDSLIVPTLTATVTAVPQPQVILSEQINLMDDSIKGIEGVAVDCKGEPVFAVSFDNKATWIMHNGTKWVSVTDELTGMTKEEFEAITTDQWQAQYDTASGMYVRCTLLDETQSLTTVNIDFVN